MAQERPAGPALDIQAGIGTFHISIKIKSDLVAGGILGAGILALRAFFIENPRAVITAIETVLSTWAAYVLSSRPSSILVEFVFYTEERYQAFMNAFATGTVKKKIQEELSKIGFKGALQVTIEGDDNAPQIRERNLAMSEAAAQTGFSEGSLSNPPELDVALLKALILPERSAKWNEIHPPIDILLLTMTGAEVLSCLSYLNPGFCKSYIAELGFVYSGEMGDGEAKQKVAVIPCGIGSAILVPKAVRALHPKAVICVGCCAGLKEEKVKFGDVIISSKLACYGPTKFTWHGITEHDVRVLASPRLSELLRTADHGWKAPLKNPNDLEVEVHKDGLLLSGLEVVSSHKRLMELSERYPDAIGAEIGDEGFYAEAHDLEIEWVVIKGVSDFAGANKSASHPWRQFSSLMAASLVAHIVSNGKVFQKLPHY